MDNIIENSDLNYVTLDDMAEILGIGLSKAYRIVKDPNFDSFKVGRHWRIPIKAIIDYIDEQKQNKVNSIKNKKGEKG